MTPQLNDEQVFALVRAELDKARTRYPFWPTDLVHAAAIASEESGEVVKAVNNRFWNHGAESFTDIRKEAIQAIAMWTRFLVETNDLDEATRQRNLHAQGYGYQAPNESEPAYKGRWAEDGETFDDGAWLLKHAGG